MTSFKLSASMASSSNLIDVPSQDTLDNHMRGKDHIEREKQLQEQRKEKALKRQRYNIHDKGIPVPPKAKRYIGENNCCSQKFSLWRMLTEHMVSDHEINSSCSQCWKQCSSRAELKSHVAFIQFAGFNRLRVGGDTAELWIKYGSLLTREYLWLVLVSMDPNTDLQNRMSPYSWFTLFLDVF